MLLDKEYSTDARNRFPSPAPSSTEGAPNPTTLGHTQVMILTRSEEPAVALLALADTKGDASLAARRIADSRYRPTPMFHFTSEWISPMFKHHR